MKNLSFLTLAFLLCSLDAHASVIYNQPTGTYTVDRFGDSKDFSTESKVKIPEFNKN